MTADSDANRIDELQRDNQRLRRLLDGRDAPGELRHRLRSTFALLRAIVRRSAETDRDLPDYVAHLQDRLDAIARAQSIADVHGEVDLQTLFADELLQYGASDGERLMLSGPDVRLQPKAGQIVALAVHELAINAVEHGVLGGDDGQIDVSWTVDGTEPAGSVTVTWTELGATASTMQARSGFGTEVLTRTLAYDLQATTEFEFGSGGLRCRLRLPLPATVGRVVPA